MADDIEFIDGLIIKPPHENAPDYVIAKLSIKRADLIAWLEGKDGEWINAEIKESKGGKYYAAVDNWKPDRERQAPEQREQAPRRQQSASQPPVQDDFADDDIPF